jgi:hypothetical protein
MRLRVNPAVGSMRLSEVRAIDLKQLLVNPLIAEGRSASNVGVTLLPLRAIYREAIEEGVVAVNPTSASSCRGCAAVVTGLPRRASAPSCWRSCRRLTGACGRPRCTPVCGAAS